MKKITYCVVLAVFFLFPFSLQAIAKKRVALIIGIERYTNLSTLNNPVRDAEAISSVLRDHGFDVAFHKNLDQAGFKKALDGFVTFSQGADEALIFYSGHGMSVSQNGQTQNVLAATDADIDCKTRRAQKVVALEDILARLAHVSRKVALFDACRNDPLPQCRGFGFQAPQLTGDKEDGANAPLETTAQRKRGIGVAGTDRQSSLLIGYSSNLGETALDGEPGRNSPYTEALLFELKANPKTPFRELLDKTAARVTERTGSQFPWVVTKGGEPEMCLSRDPCELRAEVQVQRQIEQSKKLASLSAGAFQGGDLDTAIAFALEGLPHPNSEDPNIRDRPYVLEAHTALERAIRALQSQYALVQHRQPVFFLSYSPDGTRLLTSGHDDFAMLWDPRERRRIAILAHRADVFVHSKFSPAGTYAVTLGKASDDPMKEETAANVWDARTGRHIAKIPVDTHKLLDFLTDNELVVSGKDGIHIWDIGLNKTTRTIPLRLPAHSQKEIHAFPYEQGSHIAILLTELGHSSIEFWDALTNKLLKRVTPYKARAQATLSPDHSLLLTAPHDATADKDRTLILWDLAARQEIFRFSAQSPIAAATFSADGRKFAITTEKAPGYSNNGITIVWDTASRKQLARFDGGTWNGGSDLRFSPDGQELAVMSASGFASLFDLNSRELVMQLRSSNQHAGGLSAAAYSPDGKFIATADSRGEVMIWHRDFSSLLSDASAVDDPQKISKWSHFPFKTRGNDDASIKELLKASVGGLKSYVLNEELALCNYVNSFESNKYVVTRGCSDSVIRVWDHATGARLLELRTHLTNVSQVAVDSKANIIVARGGIGGLEGGEAFQHWPMMRDLSVLVPEALSELRRCPSSEMRVDSGLPPTPPEWCQSHAPSAGHN